MALSTREMQELRAKRVCVSYLFAKEHIGFYHCCPMGSFVAPLERAFISQQ